MSINELLVNHEQKIKLNTHTCIPCEVVEINDDRVNVKPVYNGTKIGTTRSVRLETGEYVRVDDYELPAILDCPICMLVNSNARITIPIEVGDQGLLIISERDIRNWKDGKGKQLASQRKFDMNDGYFLPFINQKVTSYSKNSLEIEYKGKKIEIKSTGIEITGDIKITGNVQITGNVIINGINFSTHVHQVVAVGSPTGVPQ